MIAINYVSCSRGMEKQKGFTLIEIIVVLAILGILIAAIIPTYAALLTEAENKAALCAVAEGKARLTNQYAMMLLREDPRAHRLSDVVEAVSTDAGDYRLVFTVSRNHKEVEITAIGVRNGAIAGRASATWEIFKDGNAD
jgi:prepilin-type N-terminal cleavage/methylation domain-containing protein